MEAGPGPGFLSPTLDDTIAARDDLWRKDLWATAADLKISFNQCGLAPDVRDFFGFRVGSHYYVVNRMPMGEIVAPAIMHAITEGLAEAAAAGLDVRWRAFVDNVRFVGTKLAVARAMEAFMKLCRTAGITLNDEPKLNAPHPAADFLGLHFDYAAQLVSLTERGTTKLRAFLSALASPSLTCEAFMSGYGLMEHTSRILRLPLSSHFTARKFASRRAGEICDGTFREADPVRVWPTALPELTRWVRDLLASPPVSPGLPTSTETKFVLATDASTEGWGAVVTNAAGATFTASGKWHRKHVSDDINGLEAAAVANAWDKFGHLFGEENAITLLTDNTATMFTLRKGRARELALNGAIDRTLRLMRCNPNIRVAHIATEVNPADSLSRGLALDRGLSSTLWAVGRGKEAAALRVAAPSSFPTLKRNYPCSW